MKKIKMPWVFWLRIEKRKWFSKFWKIRGANFLSIQIFIFHVSIGMPWKQIYINSNLNDYSTLKELKNTNDANLSKGILIGNYDNLNI